MNTNPIFYIPGRRSVHRGADPFSGRASACRRSHPASDHPVHWHHPGAGGSARAAGRHTAGRKTEKNRPPAPCTHFRYRGTGGPCPESSCYFTRDLPGFPRCPHSGRGCRHRCRTPPRLHYGWFGAASPRCRSVQTAARCGRSAYHRNGQPLRRSRLLFSETHAAQEGMPAGGYYF